MHPMRDSEWQDDEPVRDCLNDPKQARIIFWASLIAFLFVAALEIWTAFSS